jgi:histidine kinase/histidine kinase/DNA gyrase B/HSP90-like ATPase
MTDDQVSRIRHEHWPLWTTVVAVWGVVALVSLGVALGEGDGPRLETIPWDHLVALELLSLTTWVVLSLPGLALLRLWWVPPRHQIRGLVAAALVGLVFSLIFNAVERGLLALVTTPTQEAFAAMILPDLDVRIVGFLAMVALVRVTPALAREDYPPGPAEAKPQGGGGVPALVTQLQSHFLFNTLNDAAELVHVDPDAADDVITRLSEFLRAALVHTRHEIATLGQELRFVRAYTEIQAVRLRDRLTVEWDIAPDTLEAAVPIFIWQPILENAFRYGADLSSGRVALAIGARRDGTDLVLWIRDSGGAADPQGRRAVATPGQGIGLRNTRERVARLYGGSGSVELRTLERGTIAVLRVPFAVDRDASAAAPLL